MDSYAERLERELREEEQRIEFEEFLAEKERNYPEITYPEFDENDSESKWENLGTLSKIVLSYIAIFLIGLITIIISNLINWINSFSLDVMEVWVRIFGIFVFVLLLGFMV